MNRRWCDGKERKEGVKSRKRRCRWIIHGRDKKKKENYEHRAVFNYHLGVFAASREGLRVDAARVQRHNSVFTILRAFPRRKGKALWKENCLSRGRISLFVLLATEQLPEYAFESKKYNVFRRIKLYILDHLKKLYFHLVLLSRSTHIFQRWDRSFWNDVIFHVNVFRAYSKTKEQKHDKSYLPFFYKKAPLKFSTLSISSILPKLFSYLLLKRKVVPIIV